MLRNKKVLVVDDENRFGQMVKVNLERHGGYEVHVETQGKGCLEAARRFDPDLILLDIVMPDMAGPEVARKIQADPRLRRKPVVFLTALSEEEASFHIDQPSRWLVLTKPIASETLAGLIAQKIKEGPSL